MSTNLWRDAILEALTVNCIRRPEHEDDPVKALADLVAWEVAVLKEMRAGNEPVSAMCGCGDRPETDCPGRWEPGCDLGANEKHARVAGPGLTNGQLTAIFEALGEASMCWEPPPTGTFDSNHAIAIGNRLRAALSISKSEAAEPITALAQARDTMINSLRASKGWMTGYAAAFVDNLIQGPFPAEPQESVDARPARSMWTHDWGGPTETIHDRRESFGEDSQWTEFREVIAAPPETPGHLVGAAGMGKTIKNLQDALHNKGEEIKTLRRLLSQATHPPQSLFPVGPMAIGAALPIGAVGQGGISSCGCSWFQDAYTGKRVDHKCLLHAAAPSPQGEAS